MPVLKRPGQPDLHYAVDDCTDPWKNASWLVLQHGNGRSGRFRYSWVPYLCRIYMIHHAAPAACATALLHFLARHDGIACHEA